MPRNQASHPLFELVNDAKIETVINGLCTEHVYQSRNRRRVERWDRQGTLGKGAFGVVYRERCQGSDRLRAVKEISKNLAAGEKLDYRRELEAIAKFSRRKYSHCFVRSDGWFESSDCIFIIMEYMELGDLQKYLKRPFPEFEVQQITGQLLEGLEFMHNSDFVHRDLKPSNVMVVERGPDWYVKITDFGISKRRQQGVTTLHTMQRGTLGFAAPEVLGLDLGKSGGSYTFAVDMWSLGVMAYYLFTNSILFSNYGETFMYATGVAKLPIDKLVSLKVSAAAQDFVVSLLAPMPEDRLTATAAFSHTWLITPASRDEASGKDEAYNDATITSAASAAWPSEDEDSDTPPGTIAQRPLKYTPPYVEEEKELLESDDEESAESRRAAGDARSQHTQNDRETMSPTKEVPQRTATKSKSNRSATVRRQPKKDEDNRLPAPPNGYSSSEEDFAGSGVRRRDNTDKSPRGSIDRREDVKADDAPPQQSRFDRKPAPYMFHPDRPMRVTPSPSGASSVKEKLIWLDRPNPLDGYPEATTARTIGVICKNPHCGERFRSLSATMNRLTKRWEIACPACSTKRPLLDDGVDVKSPSPQPQHRRTDNASASQKDATTDSSNLEMAAEYIRRSSAKAKKNVDDEPVSVGEFVINYIERSRMPKPTPIPPNLVPVPPPLATEEDAERNRIPHGYSLQHWDPREPPFIISGSVFDRHRLGKWIYDWTVYRHSSARNPVAEMAGEFWLLLVAVAQKNKRATSAIHLILDMTDSDLVSDFIESKNNLDVKLQQLMDKCVEKVSVPKKKQTALGRDFGFKFVDMLFGELRERTEKFMQSSRLWDLRFDANVVEILEEVAK